MSINAAEQQILDQAFAILDREVRREPVQLTSPALVRSYLRVALEGKESECFTVVFLDTRHCVIELREMFRGTIDSCSVYPREVVKATIELNARAVILAHNHPSGDSEPSNADRRITSRLQDALGLIEVRVLDHLVVGKDEMTSFAEKGLL